jgi:UDP-N-acetylmuramoyl-tripeptide--D-alanyl-D-alanine ligase
MAATATVLDVLDVPLTNLQQVTDTLPKGRGNTHIVNGVRVIDESYNANPTSMQAALQNLLDAPVYGRRIAVLAQMNELGDKAVKYHSDLATLAGRSDIVLCVGDLMRHLYENLGPAITKRFFESVNEDLLKCLTGVVGAGDVVMIKGSHSYFWDAQFVEKFIAKIGTSSSQ